MDVSDARADLGQIRVDVNVSMKKEEDTELGTRVEMKNINFSCLRSPKMRLDFFLVQRCVFCQFDMVNLGSDLKSIFLVLISIFVYSHPRGEVVVSRDFKVISVRVVLRLSNLVQELQLQNEA